MLTEATIVLICTTVAAIIRAIEKHKMHKHQKKIDQINGVKSEHQ